MKFAKPLAYQEINGKRVEVAVNYQVLASNLSPQTSNPTYGFKVGDYDKSAPLIIDPIVVSLVYSSYIGGSDYDFGRRIAVDSWGSAYIIGETYSTNFPLVNAIRGFGGYYDTFVTKINAAGSIVYSTYIGGKGGDEPFGIAVDTLGCAYITGVTDSTDFPTVNAYQFTLSGGYDAFVTKINAAGNGILYSTYLGGSGGDAGLGIAVDSTGCAYITGDTLSTDFPPVNAYQSTLRGVYDAFVTKINPAGSALVYSTYLGGSNDEHGLGIAVDSSGYAYITGWTYSTDFPLVNPLQSKFSETFVTKLNTTGNGIVYSTYSGGSLAHLVHSIAVDSSGCAYITGETRSTDLPLMNPIQSTLRGGYDAFVTKINAAGNGLVYSTYLGGTGDDYGMGIAADSSGSAYITGQTNSTDFPLANAYQSTLKGGYDAFVTKIDAFGGLVYSTYLGGSGGDYGQGIAVDISGNAYVTGETASQDFPTMYPFQPSNAGGSDAFVAKIYAQIIISCTYSLSSYSAFYPASGGSGSVYVTASDSTCNWSAWSTSSWITNVSPSNGTGSGWVTYSVGVNNTGSARTGTMTIAGWTFTVNQAAPVTCTYSLSSYSASYPASGGSGSVYVTASDSTCNWNAWSNASSWITNVSPSNGMGSGWVTYSVAANSGSARADTMTIAGQTFTVMQDGGGSFVPYAERAALIDLYNSTIGTGWARQK